MKFTEEKLEKAFSELLGQERFCRIVNVTSHNKQWAIE
jgi:hypothetical protein